jgi:hypothetical protein
MNKRLRELVNKDVPKAIREELISELGDTDSVGSFIFNMWHQLQDVDPPGTVPLPKMKKRDPEYKEIEKLHKQTVARHQTLKTLSEAARQRLGMTSTQWRTAKTEAFYTACLCAEALDEQTLSHGEKTAHSLADIVRVRRIAHCYERFIKDKATASEEGKFHRVIQIALKMEHSPKALIRTALSR